MTMDYGKNTETSVGGTRYSEGKVPQVGAPWLGWGPVWKMARGYTRCSDREHELVLKAEECLRRAMNDPSGPDGTFGWIVEALLNLAFVAHAIEQGQKVKFVPGGTVPALASEGVCRVSAHGSQKYALLDWNEGQSFSSLLSCAMRHLKKTVLGGVHAYDDGGSGCLHLWHVMWNLACLLDFVEQGRREEVDDVTPWIGVTATVKAKAIAVAEEDGRSVLDVLRTSRSLL